MAKLIVKAVGCGAVTFPVSMNEDAMRLARDLSKRGGLSSATVSLVDAPGAGLVGQYYGGCTTPEFQGHDRAAGLRTKLWKGA